jgi:hypothetical protein
VQIHWLEQKVEDLTKQLEKANSELQRLKNSALIIPLKEGLITAVFKIDQDGTGKKLTIYYDATQVTRVDLVGKPYCKPQPAPQES